MEHALRWEPAWSFADSRTLQRVASAFLGVSIAWAILTLLVPAWRAASPLAIAVPVPWLAALMAARANRLGMAAWILISGLWAILTLYAIFSGGVHSPSLAGYVVLVVVAGALRNIRAAVATTLLTSLSLVGFVFAEQWGLQAPLLWSADSFAAALTLLTNVVGSAVVIASVLAQLRLAHTTLDESKIDLAASEAVAHTAQERYREIADLTSEYFYSLVRHPDGRFETEFITDAFGRITGYDATSFGATDWWEMIHPEDRPRMIERERERASGEAPDSVHEHRILTAEGETRWLRDHSRIVVSEDGTVRLYGASQDITARVHHEEERNRLESELRQSQKMEAVGRLAGGVAHDFNNLLTVITGFGDILTEQTRNDMEASEAAAHIMAAAGRASSLTAQLLAFSRRSVYRQEVIDVGELIHRIEPMITRLLSERVSVELVLADESLRISGDSALIEQILINLAVNARDAMDGRGKLVIELRSVDLVDGECQNLQAGRYVFLSVEDDGCGMDEQVQTKAFEPFFTTKARGQGTGLGLSTVYGIVHQCGGAVEINSRVGHGTRVQVCLPAVDSEVDVQPSREPQGFDRLGGPSRTILVVEDELRVRELVGKLLERAGHRALLCGLPDDALRTFEYYEGEIDLVISDVAMPEMDGPELIEELKLLRSETAYLLMSGNPNYAGSSHCELPPDIAFLQKPFGSSELVDRVNRILAEAKAP